MLFYEITREKEYQSIVRANGLLYAAMATLINGQHILIIMPELDNAPEYVYSFVVNHEEGHLLYGEDEYKADSHAVTITGEKCAINALKWMFKNMNGKANIIARLEIINRIIFIKYHKKIFNIKRK